MLYCNQSGCEHVAAFRFTWPGRKEAGVCALHSGGLKNVAEAMGLALEIIPIPEVWAAMFTPDLGAASKAGDPAELLRLLRMGIEVVEDFLPNIGRCALQDIGRLNDFLLQSKKYKHG